MIRQAEGDEKRNVYQCVINANENMTLLQDMISTEYVIWLCS